MRRRRWLIVNNDIESIIAMSGWAYTVTFFNRYFYRGSHYTLHGYKTSFSEYKTENLPTFRNKASSVINVL